MLASVCTIDMGIEESYTTCVTESSGVCMVPDAASCESPASFAIAARFGAIIAKRAITNAKPMNLIVARFPFFKKLPTSTCKELCVNNLQFHPKEMELHNFFSRLVASYICTAPNGGENLKKLVDKGEIRAVGGGKNTRYVMSK